LGKIRVMPARRLLTIPGYAIAWLLCLGTAPLWLPLAAIVDGVRRNRGVTLRCAVFLTYYLSCEVLGIAISAGLWVWRSVFSVSAERWDDLHYRLEAWWGTALLRGLVRVFGLRLEVEDDADLARGPYLMLVRHSSSGDVLLASALVSGPHGMRLRYVLKRELLWDPCLDIVGHRVPNVFVDRFSDDSEREIQRTRELARDLGPRDGVLIHPEGTRFSEAKRRRVLERFRRAGDEKLLDYARSLHCVLPPRPGGTLALLEAAPEADVIVCAQTGFEGAASLAQIWRGALVNQRVRVQFRRIPRDAIPSEPGARRVWLFEEWGRVDAWVTSCRTT
jgi:1-acyl-sn-glycerol-3-phosphate acyltransferase